MSEEIKNEIAEEKVEDNKKKESWIQALKFLGFSVSAGVIQILSETLLIEVCNFDDLGLVWLASTIALILSVLWNFTFNRKFTFKDASNVPIAMLKVAAFYAVFTPLQLWWTNVLVDQNGANEYLILAMTMIINFVSEFFYQKYFVFKKPKNQ